MNLSRGLINTVEEKLKSNLLLFAILIFIIGTFTLNTFISSTKVKMIYLFLMICMFIAYYFIQKKSIIIYKLELMWLAFYMYFLFSMLYHQSFMKVYLVDILVYFSMLVYLLLVKLDIKYYKVAVNLMLIISVVYALSSVFHYVNMDLYTELIFPLFTFSEQAEILRVYRSYGSYTGFTWQTAYISGYLIYGIAIILLFFKEHTSKLIRGLSIAAFPLLFVALMLAGKRAHLLFMILALLFTYLFSTQPNIKSFLKRFLKLTLTTMVTILIGIVTFKVYTPKSGTPMSTFYNKINSTIDGLISGEDITSGRIQLYDYALELFRDNPILGIGWRGFNEVSYGIFAIDVSSHPHNIYIQLLTELGIVGFILFMIPIIYTFIKTIKLLINADRLFSFDLRWKTGLQFSLFSQAFFLLYGMTGNLLTDSFYILMWIFSASITLSAMKHSKETPLYIFKMFKS